MIPRLSTAELVRRHQAGIWRYLRYLGCDASLADDLTQDTFLAVLRKPFEQRSAAETAAYLRTVARNQFLMAMRRRRQSPTWDDLELAEQVWAEFAGDDGDEYLASLDECLAELGGRPRQAIELRYREGRGRQEIAQALEMTDDGVKTLLRRTREALRKCITRRIES